MENEARRIFHCFGPCPARGDGIGIAIEGVDGRPGVEQGAGIAARPEGRVHDHVARSRGQRGDHFVEQDGDMRRGHTFFPLVRASASSIRQAACAPSQPSPRA